MTLDTIERKLDEILRIQLTSTIPFAARWLTIQEVGAMLGYGSTYTAKLVARPDFPASVSVSKSGLRKWNAGEVSEWMKQQRKDHPSRPAISSAVSR